MVHKARYELCMGHKGDCRRSPWHRAATGPQTGRTCLIWVVEGRVGARGRRKGVVLLSGAGGVAWALGMAQGVLGRVRG